MALCVDGLCGDIRSHAKGLLFVCYSASNVFIYLASYAFRNDSINTLIMCSNNNGGEIGNSLIRISCVSVNFHFFLLEELDVLLKQDRECETFRSHKFVRFGNPPSSVHN